MPFQPKFTITARIASDLMRIEGARQAAGVIERKAACLVREAGCRLLSGINYFAAHSFERLDVACDDSMAS